MEELKAALAKMREMYAAQGEELHDMKVAQATLMRTAQQIERERDALVAERDKLRTTLAEMTKPAPVLTEADAKGDLAGTPRPSSKKAKGEAVATS